MSEPKSKKEQELKKWFEDGVKHLLAVIKEPKTFFFSCVEQLLSPKFIFLLLLATGIAWTSFHIGGCTPKRELVQLQSTFDNSNTFWAIQKTTDDGTIRDLRKSSQDYRQTTETAIINLKTDFNETKREKDEEILKLTGERDNALQRATTFETMPEKVYAVYTNLVANAPTNLYQFNSTVKDLTNALAASTPKLKFQLFVNHIPITNDSELIPLFSREVFVQVKNLGTITAERVTLVFSPYQIGNTNFVSPHDWGETPSLVDDNLLPRDGWASWRMAAINPVASGDSFDATSFQISTNCHSQYFIAQLKVYSLGSPVQYNYAVFLLNEMTNHNDLPTIR
jgi:hypothetical protein